MAYMSQERKKELAPAIQAICKKYGIKATLGVHHYSTLVLNIKSGSIDFVSDCVGNFSYQVNEYHIKNHYSGNAKDFLLEVSNAMMVGNHNNSDYQTDYFDIGWYTDINIGSWDKAYTFNP